MLEKKNEEYFTKHETDTKFSFQCLRVKLYWRAATSAYVCPVSVFGLFLAELRGPDGDRPSRKYQPWDSL